MSTRDRNRLVHRALRRGLLASVVMLVPASVGAAEPADSGAPSTADEQARPSEQQQRDKKKLERPIPTRRGLDATTRRVVRASSSSNRLDGDRVAMRTAALAPASDPPRSGDRKKKSTRDDEGARAPSDGSNRQISLDEDLLVEGKLEKPNAFYILRRSQSGYDWARLDAKFLPLVLESVQDPLF